jgi:hypothetical protein
LIKVAVTIKNISIINTTSNIGVKSIVWPCGCAFAVLFLMAYYVGKVSYLSLSLLSIIKLSSK